MDRVAIDVLSGLGRTKKGNKHILVACDYLTKWTEAWPIPDETAATCARALVQNWFCRYGVPLQLHSDAAAAFTGTLFTELSKLCDMEKTKTSGYHPRGDGLVERANRTIIHMLSIAANDHQDEWDEYVPHILAAYRSSKHASLKVTPNYLMFGRELRTPVTLLLPPPTERPITDEWVQDIQERFHYAHNLAREALGVTAKVQKTYFNRRVRTRNLWVGQSVWVYWPQKTQKGKSKKLTPCWDGPWVILRFVTEVNVEIQKGRTKLIIHVDRVRPVNVDDVPPPQPGAEVAIPAPADTAVEPEGDPQDDDEGGEEDNDDLATPFEILERAGQTSSSAPQLAESEPAYGASGRPLRRCARPQRLGQSQP